MNRNKAGWAPAPQSRTGQQITKVDYPQEGAQKHSFEHLAKCGGEIQKVAQAIHNQTFQESK